MASTFVAAKPRARLVGPWTLLAFASLIAAGLALLLFRHGLIELLARSPGGDTLTDTYLTSLHALDPADPRPALLLARTRIVQRRTDEALALVAPHLESADAAVRTLAMRLQWEILRSAGRLDALAAAVRASLQEPWGRADLLQLAGHAEATGDAGLVRTIYEQLAAHERDPRWLEEAARRFLGIGDYRYAAELFFLARHRAREQRAMRELYLAGVRALQSGNLPVEALAAAQRELGTLAQDEVVLLELVHVARSAGRPDAAAQFMKQLIWLRRPPGVKPRRDVLAWFIRSASAATEPGERMRPYDARLYSLAYEVFLADGDLESAYRIARAAVSQQPGHPDWRERLARVCEQSGRPVEALAAWRWLAEQTDSEEAWQALLRLAPGLNDEEALAIALRRQALRPEATAGDLRALHDAYERLGRPNEGLLLFESRYRSTGNLTALELAADLAEQMGRSEKAIALHLELIEQSEPTLERLVRIATLQIMAGRLSEAHALLSRFRSRVPPQAVQYWRLLADLAWGLQADASALEAFDVVAGHPNADASDFDRLVALLRARHPAEAARIAQTGFARLRTPGLLVLALEILWERRDLASLKRIYAELGPEDEALFAQVPHFYRLRAQFRRSSGDLVGARADLQRATEIAPHVAEHRLDMLWTLIELREREALRRLLVVETPQGLKDNAYWPALASGWMALDEPARALPYFARLAQASPGDFLWLVAYADALEQDGQLNAADRVRRHAWAIARRAAPSRDKADRRQREQYARLALQQAPGDPALRVLRDLLRQDSASSDAPGESERRAAVDGLVLSWMLSNEQHEQAKRWLWERYARRLAAPAWAELAVAAAEHDAAAAARVLEQRTALSVAQRAQAAQIAGRGQLATALLFQAHGARPNDDALHLELAHSLLDPANRAGGAAGFERRGVIRWHPRQAEVDLALGPRMRLGLQWREASPKSMDETELRGLPAHDREWRVAIRPLLERGWVEAGVGAREGFADSLSARLRYFQAWSRRLSALFTAARNERTLDSPALAVAGMRDELSLRARYELSKSEFLGAMAWAGVYRSQNAIRLGRVRGHELEAGHRLRIDYPDMTLRVFMAALRSRAEGDADPATAVLNPAGTTPPASFFVPPDSRRYGIGVSVGESVGEGWTRALRPYAGVDLIHNSVSGGGYHARIGMRSSILGPDRLTLYWSRGRSIGASNDAAHEYGIRYEYRFDRT
jgi:hypothetical protein